MITVIVAGGSGTRLWPLSTPTYPKQLLKINGDDKSLLQHTYNRAKQLSDSVYVVPEVSLVEHVRNQLNDLGDDAFITEPGRRGTANCILSALVHISRRHSHDEPIAFVASDHFIRDTNGFVQSFKVAAEASEKAKRIVLVGIEPTYPSTGLGYIQKSQVFDKDSFVFNVQSFTEKPQFEVAKEFLRSGNYLWNAGYFIGSVNTFVESMKTYAPDLYASYEKLLNASPETFEDVYMSLESEAIDYALMEHITDNLLVVPAAFDWMDLGSFGDLHKAVDSNEEGNHTFGDVELDDCSNSFVQNLDDKPVAVVGMDNVVVVNTKHGILVARKDLAQKIGAVSKRIDAKTKEKNA